MPADRLDLAPLDIVAPTPGAREFFAVWPSLSADGRVAAWTSYIDHCAAGLPYNPNAATNRDLWVWFDVGLPVPASADAQCDAVEGGGKIARFLPHPVDPTDDSFAVITPDASAVILISTANLGANLFEMPSLFLLDLVGGGVKQLSPPLPLGDRVEAATVSGDGRVVAFTTTRALSGGLTNMDNSLIRLDVGSVLPAVEPFGQVPADQPVDAELLACSVAGGRLDIEVRLRQWQGHQRTLLITAEGVGSSSTVVMGPVVQELGPGETVDVKLSAPYTESTAACSARAVDAASTPPDVAEARLAP